MKLSDVMPDSGGASPQLLTLSQVMSASGSAGGDASSTKQPPSFGQALLHAGRETLEQAGLMPPSLRGMTPQEYHPAQGGFLAKVGHAAKLAGEETLPFMNLAMGPGTALLAAATHAMPQLPASGISPERAMLAKEAKDTFGIPVTAGQVGMSGAGKLMESASRNLPFSGNRAFEASQRQAFNRAVSKTFGEDAPAITQTVMDTAKRRIGAVLDRIERSNAVMVDNRTIGRLAQIEYDADRSLTTEEFRVVKRQIDNVLQQIGPRGTIPGESYGALLRKNGPLDKAMGNANSNIAKPAGEIADTLRDALQQSLSGKDLAAYRQARAQYKSMKTIEPLAAKSPTGDISPAGLNHRVSAKFPNRAYDTSGHPLDRLAKIGQAFLKEPPTSGTAERGAAYAEMAKIAAPIAAGEWLGGIQAAAATGGVLAANRALAAYLRSQGLAARTIAKALAGAQPILRQMSTNPQAIRMLPGVIFGAADNGHAAESSPEGP